MKIKTKHDRLLWTLIWQRLGSSGVWNSLDHDLDLRLYLLLDAFATLIKFLDVNGYKSYIEVGYFGYSVLLFFWD